MVQRVVWSNGSQPRSISKWAPVYKFLAVHQKFFLSHVATWFGVTLLQGYQDSVRGSVDVWAKCVAVQWRYYYTSSLLSETMRKINLLRLAVLCHSQTWIYHPTGNRHLLRTASIASEDKTTPSSHPPPPSSLSPSAINLLRKKFPINLPAKNKSLFSV